MTRSSDDLCPHGRRRWDCTECKWLDKQAGQLVDFGGNFRVRCACGQLAERNKDRCEACERRRQRRSSAPKAPRRTGRAQWELTAELRSWQSDAMNAWNANNQRGVIEAATGTGKTMVAFAAIAEQHRKHGDRLRVAIVVPTMQLARQWRDGLSQHLFLPRHLIGEQHSTADVNWTPDHPILVTVINTARTQLKKVTSQWAREGASTLLIVDECHRAGAESNARIFESSFNATIGLSATPDRDDDGDTTHVYPNLGRPVFSYPLLRALDDEVLAPLCSVNLYVDFTPEEQSRWDATAEALTNAMRSLRWEHPDLDFDSADIFARIGRLAEAEDPAALRVVALLSNRRELLAQSVGRRKCIGALISWLTTNNRKTIAFHETIAGAQKSLSELESRRLRAVLDHSQMKPKDRQESLALFARPTTQVLVAVRSLDEGLDVPDADVAMILAGSRSKRQRIQRIGRVVRPQAGKQALAITVLIRGTPEETVTGSRDESLLGPTRVAHHRWPEVAVDEALAGATSSYQPVGDGLRFEVDRITMRWANRPATR